MKHWGISINVDGVNIVNMESASLSGIDNVADYREEILYACESMIAFIGKDAALQEQNNTAVALGLEKLLDRFDARVDQDVFTLIYEAVERLCPARSLPQALTTGSILTEGQLEASRVAINNLRGAIPDLPLEE